MTFYYYYNIYVCMCVCQSSLYYIIQSTHDGTNSIKQMHDALLNDHIMRGGELLASRAMSSMRYFRQLSHLLLKVFLYHYQKSTYYIICTKLVARLNFFAGNQAGYQMLVKVCARVRIITIIAQSASNYYRGQVPTML